MDSSPRAAANSNARRTARSETKTLASRAAERCAAVFARRRRDTSHDDAIGSSVRRGDSRRRFRSPGWSLRGARKKDAKRADGGDGRTGDDDGRTATHDDDGGILRTETGSIPRDDEDSHAGRAATRAGARARRRRRRLSPPPPPPNEPSPSRFSTKPLASPPRTSIARWTRASARPDGSRDSPARRRLSMTASASCFAPCAPRRRTFARRGCARMRFGTPETLARGRARSASPRGGDATASAASTASAAAREASRATSVALEAYESATEARVVAALHRGLASLVFAVDRALRERQRRAISPRTRTTRGRGRRSRDRNARRRARRRWNSRRGRRRRRRRTSAAGTGRGRGRRREKRRR